MSMLDEDESETCPKYVSWVANGRAKFWDAAQITTFLDGKWVVFLDGAHALLNCPPRPTHDGTKVSYRYKGYRPHEPPPPPDPLSIPKSDNYTAFRAPRRIYGLNHRPSPPRQIWSARGRHIDDAEIYGPDAVHRRRFRGAEPARSPFRRSVALVNAQRARDAPQKIRQQVETASAPSLFKRSIKLTKQKSVLSLRELSAEAGQ
jgi:hypothetical protein